MLDRILLYVALAASLAANAHQAWHARGKINEGRAIERAEWVARLNEKNQEIEKLNEDLTRRQADWENLRRIAALRASMIDVPSLPASVVAICSLPDAVRVELNKIGGTR